MMKKRVYCLILGLLMLVLSFAGCGGEEVGFDDEEERLAMTINLMIPTNSSTTAEAVSAVQDALNNIFNSKLKTRVVIEAIPEDQYMERLDDKFSALETEMAEKQAAEESRKKAKKEAKKRGETLPPETTEAEVTGDETIMNDIGFSEIKYPEMTENQIDIFFMSGIDNLRRYYDAERLAILDDDIGSTSKKLSDFIYPTFMDAAKISGSSVAVINNHVIGEYVFLLIDKELADKYYYDTSEFTTLSDAVEFVEDMAVSEPDYTPFLREVDCYSFISWGDEKSFYGAEVNEANVFGKKMMPIVEFQSRKFQTHYSIMKLFKEKGYFSDDPDNDTKFAAAVMKGSLQDMESYKDKYYVTVLQNPVALNEDVYAGMFCINGYNTSKRTSRSMEILTLINTDSTVRNLLQYGIEGVNYRLVDGVVKRLNNDYSMKLVNTGNAFVAYPEEGMESNAWEYGKKQNLDSTTYSLIGYSFKEKDLALFIPSDEMYERVWGVMDSATYADLFKESDYSSDDLNPYDEVTDILRFEDRGYTSITTVSSESNFAARLAEWFNSNF